MDETATPPTPTDPPAVARSGLIAVIGNPSSGRNSRDEDAVGAALKAFGPGAELYRWSPETDIAHTVERALADGAELIVAAGGDGTAMAVAQSMLGQSVPMAVLPLGTFNFFARGLRLSEDPVQAAQAIRDGTPRSIHVGQVNKRVFLNNASLGIYPAILKAREDIYARWGRRRVVAHWSVIKTFLRFQRPMNLRITADGDIRNYRTPLVFVARSAYQLELFGLRGAGAISDDHFAVLVAKGGSRADLFRLAARLVMSDAREGRDYELIRARDVSISTGRRRALLAFDGEKSFERSPFHFEMSSDLLNIVQPVPEDAEDAA
ncbi:hypothetical protein FGG78_01600 [Thioclava sp. BHET1]|nr:hypothetical protein FGG78_01600 [Thioclava sp. BHET1]